MASTQAAFEVKTRSPKQASALVDAVLAKAERQEAFSATATQKGSSAVVEASLCYKSAAVGPGHLQRTIETASRSAEGVEIRSIERV